MNYKRLQPLACTLVLIIGAVLTVCANGAKPPIGRYAQLWTDSALTMKVERAPGQPDVRKGDSPEALHREIEQLKKRVAALEKELEIAKKKDGGSPEQAHEIRPLKRPDLPGWLDKHEPKPTTDMLALANLEKILRHESKRNGLTIKRMKLHPTAQGNRYDRARIEIEVSGKEPNLYRWLDRLHSPAAFHGLTFFRINPKRDDITQVDCLIIVEQWFLPEEAKERGTRTDSGEELLPLIDPSHYPIELMLHLSHALPRGSIRFQRVEIYNQLTEDRLIGDIRIYGVAETLQDVITFNHNLKKARAFHDYVWMMPSPMETKGGDWSFVCSAEFKPKDE